MGRTSDVGGAIRKAIERLRGELHDRAAAIVVITPSAVTKELARRALGANGPSIRVDFKTSGELVSQLGSVRVLRTGRSPEVEGWLSSTILALLHRLTNDARFSERARMLLAPGWLPILVHALREVEGADVTPEQVRSLEGDHDRLELLGVLTSEVHAAREREGLYSHADLARVARNAVDDSSLPINRVRGVIVLGDAAMVHTEYEAVAVWIAARRGIRIVVHPLENVAPAPLGLREAAAALPTIEAEVTERDGLGHLRRTLFGPFSTGPCDDSIRILRTPDDRREMREVVREIQRAVHAGTPLDRIAVALPDGESAEVLEDQLRLAGLPSTWLIGPTIERTAPVRLLHLALDIALGDESIRTWHRFLRFPGLKLGTVSGPGRWRRILASSGAISLADLIRNAVELWSTGLDQEKEDSRAKRESARSLIECLDRASTAISAFPREGSLAEHARAWRGFLRSWLIPSRDRSRLIRILEAWTSSRSVSIELRDARRLLDDALRTNQVLRGGLADRSIRILPPMELLAGEYDLVCIAGMTEGRFPKKRSEDVFLTDAIVDEIRRRTGRRLLTSAERSDLERRRLAAAVGSARAKLCLFVPATDFMTGRPTRPGRLLLDVAGSILGRRARFEDLRDMMERAGSRGVSIPSRKEDTIGSLEFLLARIGADPQQLAGLASHPIAWRLLRLHRSVDLFRRGTSAGAPYLDAWTGRIAPTAVRCAASGDGAASISTFSEAALQPGSFFFRRILRAWPSAYLTRKYDPTHKKVVQELFQTALAAALSLGGDLSDAFDLAWDELQARRLAHAPPIDPVLLDIAKRLGRAQFDRVSRRNPELSTARLARVPMTSLDDLLPWDIQPGEVLTTGDVVLEISAAKLQRKNVKADDGFALALLSIGLNRAGVRVTNVHRIDIEGDRTKGDLSSLTTEVLSLARRTHARAQLGFWPVFGAQAFMLAGERSLEVDPLDTALIDRCLEALRR